MDEQVLTTQETTQDSKPIKVGSWRLNQAIDMLLDYLMRYEEARQGDIRSVTDEIELAF